MTETGILHTFMELFFPAGGLDMVGLSKLRKTTMFLNDNDWARTFPLGSNGGLQWKNSSDQRACHYQIIVSNHSRNDPTPQGLEERTHCLCYNRWYPEQPGGCWLWSPLSCRGGVTVVSTPTVKHLLPFLNICSCPAQRHPDTSPTRTSIDRVLFREQSEPKTNTFETLEADGDDDQL